jgi:hypothetical protein
LWSDLKDKTTNNDAALAGLVSALKEASSHVTGREVSNAEHERWRDLGEVLAAELKIAAARTGAVSSAPAFLAEHLRRRLFKKDKRELTEEVRETTQSNQGSLQLTQEQISKCPDCGGSGMYYPDGYEKGVAKCRHQKLLEIKQESDL